MSNVSLKNGKVVQNSGARVPIHVRMLLDEFANTGKIPDFSEKVATIRKYEISVMIILQSLQQMKNLYEKEWEAISGNCDNTIYLGGGADTVTTEWMSKLLGKETRFIQGETFNSGAQGGGSQSINRQGVELFSPDRMRTMDESECIVLQKSLYAYKGKKFPAAQHKNWHFVSDTPDHKFNSKRQSFLYREYIKAGLDEESLTEDQLVVLPETKEEEKKRKKENEREEKKAAEFRNNNDINRKPVVSQPSEIRENEDKFAKEALGIGDEAEIEEVISSIVESDDISSLEIEFETQQRFFS